MPTGFLADVTDDDGKVTRDDIAVDNDNDTEEDVDLEEILAGITSEEDDAEEATEEEEGEEENDNGDDEGESQEQEPEITPDQEAIINKRVVEEVNRIIPERLKRDRKAQQVTHLEQLTGMPLEQITQQIVRNMAESKAEELGISVEEAQELLKDKIENAGIKANQATQKQQDEEYNAAMQRVRYLEDKTNHMKKPKLARVLTKEIIDEVDNFTQNGSILTFEDGLKYVLGAKLANGELINKLQAGAEKKAQASVQKKVAAPQSKQTGSVKSEGTLTRDEKIFAANLGISEKEYAAEKLKEQNRKQRRGR